MKHSFYSWLRSLTLFVAFPLFANEREELRNPNDPLDQGGETCATATPITARPYCDAGTTVGYSDNYASSCAQGIHAPDVVYSIIVPVMSTVTFSLCGSNYNTALTIWQGCPSAGGTLVCCSNDVCGVNACCAATLFPGSTYYVVVDGGSTTNSSGDYILNVVNGADVCPSTICAPDSCEFDSHDNEPNNNNCSATGDTIMCGDTLCGYMEANSNDFYWFYLPGPGWNNITVDVFGDDTPGWYPYGRGLNPRLEIQSCSEVYVADGDGGVGADAHIESYCLPAGEYLLRVAAEPQSGSGPYVVTMNCTPCLDDCPYQSRDNEWQNLFCELTDGTISCGDTLCGSLVDHDSIDYYQFIIPPTGQQRLFIDVFGDDTPGYFTFGQGLDPRVWVIPGYCSGFAADDDNGGVGNDARIDTLCLLPDTFYIRVEHTHRDNDGPYILTVNCAPCDCDYPNLDFESNATCNGGGGGTILLGDTVCGNQEIGSNDYYFFEVPGPTCKLVSIDAFGDDTPGFYPFTRGLNPQLTLYAMTPNCASLASDQNSGVGEDARLDSICLEPGLYRLHVAGVPQGVSTGPYILATSFSLCGCGTCDYANGDIESNNTCTTYSGSSITCGDTVCGVIDHDGGPDLLNFTVLGFECKIVTIDAFADDTPGFYPFGLGLNSHLILYDDTTCVSIIQDDNDGIGSDARLQVCLDPGTYRLRISGFTSGTVGPWIIATACEPCVQPTCAAPDSVVIQYPAVHGFGNPLQDVELSWPPVPFADEYRIYRSSDNNDPLIVTPANFIGTTTDTHYVDENVVTPGDYEVKIYQIVSYCNENIPCE